MDVLRELKRELRGKPHSQQRVVAQAAGVPYHTLRKLVKGYISNPSYKTVEKLRKYFEGQGLL